MAVVAGRSNVDTTLGRFTMHRSLVDLDRMVDQDVVLARNVEIFVAPTAGRWKIRRMST